jgi:hypothetical protein
MDTQRGKEKDRWYRDGYATRPGGLENKVENAERTISDINGMFKTIYASGNKYRILVACTACPESDKIISLKIRSNQSSQ